MSATLAQFLGPDSIAIIGASKDPAKRGNVAIRALLGGDFPGKIYPIHPRESEIEGLKCYPDLASVPGPIDLALVCTPAHTLPAIMADCGRHEVKGAVVLASGFGEASPQGAALERDMVEAARTHGVRIVGPNTSGIFNTHKRANLAGFPDLPTGGLGLLTQSGNMALAIVTEGTRMGHLGYSTYIGIGNESEIRFDEYMDYFGDDPNTQAVVSYVEGLKRGKEFLQAARRVSTKKPIVLFKGGRSEAGQASARSHTGALAGSYAVAEGVMRQAGVVLVDRADELLPIAQALTACPVQQGNRIVVLTDGGGQGTIAADALSAAGLSLPALHETTINPIAEKVSGHNPYDLAGSADANPEVFAECVDAILADDTVDALLVVGLFGGYHIRFAATLADAEQRAAERMAESSRKFGKPVIVHSLYANHRSKPIETLRAAGVPVQSSIETAVTCLDAMAAYGAARRRLAEGAGAKGVKAQAAGSAILKQVRADGRLAVLEHEGRDLLRAYGVALPEHLFIGGEGDLAGAVAKWPQTPLAMKLVSRDILHKSDAGGVRLKLQGADALREAREAILASAGRYQAGAVIDGVLVTPMAQPGVEIILGVTRDPQFGHVMMFGLGGIFVEVLKDVTFRALPLSHADAHEMIAGIRARKILDGVRGGPAVNREALAELMLRLSDLVTAHPEIEELDLNPVLCHADGVTPVDVRILLGKEGG